jgi:hypothetical protein
MKRWIIKQSNSLNLKIFGSYHEGEFVPRKLPQYKTIKVSGKKT